MAMAKINGDIQIAVNEMNEMLSRSEIKYKIANTKILACIRNQPIKAVYIHCKKLEQVE